MKCISASAHQSSHDGCLDKTQKKYSGESLKGYFCLLRSCLTLFLFYEFAWALIPAGACRLL